MPPLNPLNDIKSGDICIPGGDTEVERPRKGSQTPLFYLNSKYPSDLIPHFGDVLGLACGFRITLIRVLSLLQKMLKSLQNIPFFHI